MRSINTVLGLMSPDELGITMMHEHICLHQEDFRGLSLYYAITGLKRARRLGVRTLCECTPVDILPDEKAGKADLIHRIPSRSIMSDLQTISKESGLNILCSVGYYGPDAAPGGLGYAPGLKDADAETLAERMVKAITEGISDTGVRAGFIKVGSHHVPLTSMEKRVFKAAALAQSRTGVAICTHAVTGCGAQQKVLMENGADPDHCYYSHIEAEMGWEGRSLEEEAEYLIDVASKGSGLFFNNFYLDPHTPWEDMTYLMRRLIDAGYLSKVLIGIDHNWRVWPDGVLEFEHERENPDCRKRNYTFLFEHEVPRLLEAGFKEKEIHAMLLENPRSILAPYKP